MRLATGAGAGATTSSDFGGDIVALLVERDMVVLGWLDVDVCGYCRWRVRNPLMKSEGLKVRVGFGLALPERDPSVVGQKSALSGCIVDTVFAVRNTLSRDPLTKMV